MARAMPMSDASDLPIRAVLDDVRRALREQGAGVLVAPPGAGKTTGVPLALLDEAWLGPRKILLLEPRRIAARAAAERMAHLLGDKVGGIVGIRSRLDTRVSRDTRIEVVTEGVFTRLILDNPELEGVGAILFDEFHERSLDADLGLAFALDARAALAPEVRLLVMSATLDHTAVAGLIGDAPVIHSEGRAYPVETRYLGRQPHQRLEDAMADAILRAVRQETGSVLAFLPGQAEIRRTEERILPRLASEPALASIRVYQLHGGLDGRQQQDAIAPTRGGERKIVLATSVAQTSITIDGVRIVVDGGVERVPRYEPDIGVTRLETVRVSRATADQRRGRAGRTEPGVCYRLWDEPQTAGLAPFTDPEIRAADLSGLLLDCTAWGVTDPLALTWLDPPPAGALAAARTELKALDAIDADGRLTEAGRRLRALPLPARLARMIVDAGTPAARQKAAEIAALIVERGLGGRGVDVDSRLGAFRNDRAPRSARMRQMAEGWARAAGGPRSNDGQVQPSSAALLALAYPDRIAKRRGGDASFLMANGRAAAVDTTDPLSRADYLVVAELSGAAAGSRILLAAELAEAEFRDVAGDQLKDGDEVSFDAAAAALRARRVERVGAIVLSSRPLPPPTDEAAATRLASGLARLGIGRLPWTKAQVQLRDRVAFLRQAMTGTSAGDEWPDVTDAGLAATAESWLAPFIVGRTSLAAITGDDLGQALETLIPYGLRRTLEAEAPTHFEAPTGNRHAIDYEGEGAPILAIRVQELFGLTTHPTIAGGRRPLTLHLLSPAHRPIQITRDLPGFWAGSWRDVKTDMKGRYPRHPWPDDPAHATPTARAKPRGT